MSHLISVVKKVVCAGFLFGVASCANAAEWKIQNPEDENPLGIYVLRVTPEIYRNVTRSPLTLPELRLVNQHGDALPHVVRVQSDVIQVLGAETTYPLTWYSLPKQRANIPGSNKTQAVYSGWIFDLGEPKRVEKLRFSWKPLSEALDGHYELSASNRLGDWTMISSDVQLVDLQQTGEQRLQINELDIPVNTYRYFRLVPLDPVSMPELRLDQVSAQGRTIEQLSAIQWISAPAQSLSNAPDPNVSYFEFDLGGPFPITGASIQYKDQVAMSWNLESRDTVDGVWQQRATGIVSFDSDLIPEKSLYRLSSSVADRYWRLSPSKGSATVTPVLQLAYSPVDIYYLSKETDGVRLQVTPFKQYDQDKSAVDAVLSKISQSKGTLVLSKVALGEQLSANPEYTPSHPSKQTGPSTWMIVILVLAMLLVIGMSLKLLFGGAFSKKSV